MLATGLTPLPPDPILGMAQVFAADPSPQKVDLGVGVYYDEFGHVPVLQVVKQAERWLVETQTTKEYLSSVGNPVFNLATLGLLFGDRHPVLTEGRATTLQTPGGTGALRVAADFLRETRPNATVWLSDPTWPNHASIFAAARMSATEYPYYDFATDTIRFDAMLAALTGAKPNDVVVLHGCCHNPTGADLSADQWSILARTLLEKNLLPLVDLAYQGFASTPSADAASVRLLASELPELIVANSYSKNFGLYRERVGSVSFVSERSADADLIKSHVMRLIRSNYSMPPDHGAAVVANILLDADLRPAWERELEGMRDRIRAMRTLLACVLNESSARSYDFIAKQSGMFTTLRVSRDAVRELRETRHVHIGPSGRMNLAALTTENVEYVAEALLSILSNGKTLGGVHG